MKTQISEETRRKLSNSLRRAYIEGRRVSNFKNKIYSKEEKRLKSKKMKQLWKEKNWDDRNRKLSKSLQGKKFSEEHKKNISLSLKGRISARKGIIMSEEQKKKISETKKERFRLGINVHPFLGKKLTMKHKEKIRIANLGKKQSELTKLKHREAMLVRIRKLPEVRCLSCGENFKPKVFNQKYHNTCWNRLNNSKKSKKEIASGKYDIRALAKRSIPLREKCDICQGKNNLQRHHWRYDKPLLVNTLCKTCHDIQHTKDFYGSKFGGLKNYI
jgi:hypothetical protein